MTTQTEIAVKRFITEARDLFVTEPDPDTRWQKMGPALTKLLADPDFLMNSKDWPFCIPTDRAENLVFYEDPDYGFCVNGLVKKPSRPARASMTTPTSTPSTASSTAAKPLSATSASTTAPRPTTPSFARPTS